LLLTCFGTVAPTVLKARKREYGGLKGDAMKRLKALEEENRRLRRAVAMEV
jgi:hypothetical protein